MNDKKLLELIRKEEKALKEANEMLESALKTKKISLQRMYMRRVSYHTGYRDALTMIWVNNSK